MSGPRAYSLTCEVAMSRGITRCLIHATKYQIPNRYVTASSSFDRNSSLLYYESKYVGHVDLYDYKTASQVGHVVSIGNY